MQLIVVHNAEAGAGQMNSAQIEQLLRDAGHQVEIIEREDRTWHERLEHGCDAVVAAGGDGTVQQVIHDVVGTNIPVAILPIGTANNIAHSLGYMFGDQLAARIADWPAREQRLAVAGVARGGWRAAFIEAVGVGAFAGLAVDDEDITPEHTALAIARMRKMLIEKLLDAVAMPIEIDIDGDTFMGEYLLVEVLNLCYVGPRLLIAPDETPGEAMFTVCAVDVKQRDAAAHWVGSGAGDPRRFALGRGHLVHVRTTEPMHVDGEGTDQLLIGDIRLEAGVRSVRVWV